MKYIGNYDKMYEAVQKNKRFVTITMHLFHVIIF